MADFIVKYRWLIISVSMVLGIGFGLLIPKAETDPEIRNYIPRTMPSRLTTDSIEQEFGVQDMIIVLFKDSLILTPSNLRQIKSFDRAFSRTEGIGTVNSLFTARKIESRDGMMIVDPLIARIPETKEGLDQLRMDILSNRFACDVVVSSDMSSAAITGTVNAAVIPESVTLARVDSIIDSQEGDAAIMAGGLPYIRRHIMEDVTRDGLILIPLALVVMLLVLKLSLGRWKRVFLPFTVVVLSTAVTMGMIPLFGWKISILSLLVPIILISVANNYGIYLVSRDMELGTSDIPLSRKERVRAITGLLNMPILFSGLTTIAGILGLLAHSIIPARQVGILAAVGVTIALLMSLLFIPALMCMKKDLPKERIKPVRHTDFLDRAAVRISSIVTKRPGKVLLVSAIVTFLVGTGIFMVAIDTNQENFFPRKHPVRRASEIINTKFGGSQTVSVMISGDILDPNVMKSIDDLTEYLRQKDGVGNVFSISDVVREMSKALYDPGQEEYDRIPYSGDAIAQMFELYNMSGDPDDLKQLINFENTRAHLLIRLSKPENEIIRNLRDDIASITVDFPAKITTGGYAIIMADFAQNVIEGQVSSLLFALLTVFVLLSVIFRSVKGGLIGSIPLAASIMIQFGVMGFTGIALDAATALLSSIMIGVGVDFTIQYLWRYNSELRSGLSHTEATARTFRTTGRTIMINALSVMAGFSATFFSGFLSIRFFGYLVLLSIGSCLLCAIIVIPAFMLWFKPLFIEADLKRAIIKKVRNEKDAIPVLSGVGFGASARQGTAVRSRATDGTKP
ncbi:MAG: MMPL family transporter [Bacteroidales bacterium]|nr:MMPL family transporter [Bacteroidales bacterium]